MYNPYNDQDLNDAYKAYPLGIWTTVDLNTECGLGSEDMWAVREQLIADYYYPENVPNKIIIIVNKNG